MATKPNLSQLIVRGRTGRLSLTKLAAATAHFLLAVFFTAWNIALLKKAFVAGVIPDGLMNLWFIYIGAAGLHHIADKYLPYGKGENDVYGNTSTNTMEVPGNSGGSTAPCTTDRMGAGLPGGTDSDGADAGTKRVG